jgi:hypothetical protein
VAGGFVAVELEVDVLVLVLVGLVAVVVCVIVVVCVAVVLVDVVVDDELLVVAGALEQWSATSSLTVSAPWPRLAIKVVLTFRGSCPTRLLKCRADALARAHFPASTADEIEASCDLSALA